MSQSSPSDNMPASVDCACLPLFCLPCTSLLIDTLSPLLFTHPAVAVFVATVGDVQISREWARMTGFCSSPGSPEVPRCRSRDIATHEVPGVVEEHAGTEASEVCHIHTFPRHIRICGNGAETWSRGTVPVKFD